MEAPPRFPDAAESTDRVLEDQRRRPSRRQRAPRCRDRCGLAPAGPLQLLATRQGRSQEVGSERPRARGPWQPRTPLHDAGTAARTLQPRPTRSRLPQTSERSTAMTPHAVRHTRPGSSRARRPSAVVPPPVSLARVQPTARERRDRASPTGAAPLGCRRSPLASRATSRWSTERHEQGGRPWASMASGCHDARRSSTSPSLFVCRCDDARNYRRWAPSRRAVHESQARSRGHASRSPLSARWDSAFGGAQMRRRLTDTSLPDPIVRQRHAPCFT